MRLPARILIPVSLGLATAVHGEPNVLPFSCDGQPDREVVALQAPRPPFPYLANAYCISGYGTYQFTIGIDGRVSNIKVVASQPEGVFDAAGEILRTWRFSPRCIDGGAVPRTATQTIMFNLDDIEQRHCPDELPDDLFDAVLTLHTLYVNLNSQLAIEGSDLSPITERPVLPGVFGKVEAAHRRAINGLLDLERQIRIDNPAQLSALWQPQSMAADDWAERTGKQVEAMRKRFEQRIQRFNEIDATLAEALRRVDSANVLTTTEREILIEADLKQIAWRQANTDRLQVEERTALERAAMMIDTLIAQRDSWVVVDGELKFSTQALADSYDSMREQLDQVADERVRMQRLRSRIYWSSW